MTDRKTLMIAVTFIAVTLAAAVWRIGLLPDWTLFSVSGGTTAIHSYRALGLFFAPAWLVVFTGLLLARGWFSRSPAEEQQPWQSQGRLMLIVCGTLVTAMQFFTIARSFGMAGSLNPVVVARATLALTGALMIVTGNQLPKLPWPQLRLKALALEPAQGAKLLRFNGWMAVGLGAGLVVSAATLPMPLLRSAVWILILGFLVLTFARRIQLKREQLH